MAASLMKPHHLHIAFLLALPVIVAAFGLSVITAIVLVAVVLLWRLAIILSGLFAEAGEPDLELETISASHFVEKVRWCMDRLGVDYRERHTAGLLGIVSRGRTVPQLRMRTGRVTSEIGNSPEILRYLWGRYSAELGDAANFLEPTPERLEWEQRIDRYGVQLQVWIYSHMLADRDLTLHAWGRNSSKIPLYQRWLLVIFYPVLAAFLRYAFQLDEAHLVRSREKIEKLLGRVENRLVAGNRTILDEEQISFVDIAFAAMTGLWLQPRDYGGGQATDVMIARDQLPPAMRADVEKWIANFPRTERYVQRLYREQRGVSNAAQPDPADDRQGS